MKKISTYESVRNEGLLLNANEMSRNLPEVLRREICDALMDVDFNRYPDPSQKEILEAYAAVSGLKESQLLAGNGSDQMLGYVICYYLGKGKKLYTLAPDFSMYDYYASSYEAETIKYRTEEDGSFDTDDFIRTGKEQKADMVMFSNPNNPTGHCLNRDEVIKILEAFSDIPVVIDEAYMEFSRVPGVLDLIEEYRNLYVTRTLSKAFGLAGIRLGFLAAAEENMEKLKGAFIPYALNSLTMKAGVIALSHSDSMEAVVRNIQEERQRVYEACGNMKRLHFYPSEANFLYGVSGHKKELMDLMKQADIVIRDYAGSDHFRITIGTNEENERILAVLRKFEEAV